MTARRVGGGMKLNIASVIKTEECNLNYHLSVISKNIQRDMIWSQHKKFFHFAEVRHVARTHSLGLSSGSHLLVDVGEQHLEATQRT